ncbi:hypothetical protein [Phaffia rhodozyma]|uniref:Protein CPL1-like domain-containing protein n=1 Tax=Phaffia rhodozyma TaxID=264483 RepID=A0A0F7SU21_PHARH|nr:hypothetical protein [Phaffia rhodozyma]
MFAFKILAVLAATSHLAMAVTAPATISLNNINVVLTTFNLGSLCVCATPTGLTASSTALLNTASVKTGVSTALLGPLEAAVDAAAIAALNLLPATCTYPTNSIPNDCSGACGFACATGFQRCSGHCVANGQTCISPGARRRNLNARSRNACPGTMTACPIKTLSGSAGFECIDTKANLESCGGCVSPFPGDATGQDCTTIANAYNVECENAKCVIKECARGFVINSEGSACVPRQAVSLGRLIFEGAPLVFSN